jgi:hypothetical protein
MLIERVSVPYVIMQYSTRHWKPARELIPKFARNAKVKDIHFAYTLFMYTVYTQFASLVENAEVVKP